MSVDEFTKLILIFAIVFAIVGISWQLMRLIGKLADSVEDMRPTIKNVGKMSDQMVEDYKRISNLINSGVGFVTKLKENISGPGKMIAALLAGMNKSKSAKSSSTN